MMTTRPRGGIGPGNRFLMPMHQRKHQRPMTISIDISRVLSIVGRVAVFGVLRALSPVAGAAADVDAPHPQGRREDICQLCRAAAVGVDSATGARVAAELFVKCHATRP